MPNVVVVGEKLQFSSMEHFQAYLKDLTKLPQTAISGFNKSIGFTSLYQHNFNQRNSLYNQIRSSFPDAALPMVCGDDSLITDDVFASVLNKDYELVIGDWHYKATADYCFLVKKGYENLKTKFLQDINSQTITLKKGEKYVFEDKFIAYVPKRSSSVSNGVAINEKQRPKQEQQRVITGEVYFDNRHRMHYKVWQENWYVYASSGAEVIMEAKEETCFLWWCWEDWTRIYPQATTLHGDYDVHTEIQGIDYPKSGSYYYNDTQSYQKEVFDWNTGILNCEWGIFCYIEPASEVEINSSSSLHGCKYNNVWKTAVVNW